MILLARNNSQCIVNDIVILFSVKHNFHKKSNVTKVTLELFFYSFWQYVLVAATLICTCEQFNKLDSALMTLRRV